eukprot:CAMPEP_0185582094 /NCGR_PEP_ID=MMETSP0434-20130131/19789_1 /TAXON_ID=626734 ORGANISM="Favella taraikaensis, Strain Fe Narragansett Bay" /NCGR_SAMPLE_ID=MMETSP0434 /ASSEMBLY_ACC=CAM_ASM_000379 /LENGTH=177 /DNA_ID=CAMNT_0028200801 /DNA_START=27 /DNA_END=560 /DNA_ORIENTATION=+
MADEEFDWSSIPYASVESGHCAGALVGEVESGTVHSAWPLTEDGNYSFWLYGDPYKATISKEDGTEVEEDIYEAHNLTLLIGGDSNPMGQGVRVNQVKYMRIRDMEAPTYDFPVGEEDVSFHFDKVWFYQKGKQGLVIAVRDGYFFVGSCDCNKPEQQTALCAKGLAMGAYWLVGGD